MNPLKKIARKIVFPTMLKFHIDQLIQYFAGNAILNIMYHGVVVDDSTYFSPRHITTDQFEKQLIYYKKNFDIISVTEAFNRVQNNIPSKKKTLTISFDDGFKNNLTTALPLLEKHNIPTTFFISGICVEEMKTRTLWSEFIAALNYFYKDTTIQLGKYQFANLHETTEGFSLADFLKSCSYSERESYLQEIKTTYNLATKIASLPNEIWELMTKEELRDLAKSSIVDIGSHGYNHYNLGEISLPEAKKELVNSKKVLQEITGQEINMIGYPDGSYTTAIKDLAEEVGYRYQMAVNYKCSTDSTDQRIMNRHGVSSTTTFASTIISLSTALIKKSIKI